jgi:transposase InsO family protein
LTLVRRVIEQKRRPAHVAAEMGVSRTCVYTWLARYRAEGEAGLQDRSSRPHASPNQTPAETEERVIQARQELRGGPDRVAEATGVPARTVTRILRRYRVPRLAECDPLTGAPIRACRRTTTRYEHPYAGSLIHLDVKKIGRIPDGGGWRAHGRGERPADKRGAGYDYIHVAVDDHSRLAYAEVLPDEKGTTCAGFLTRAAAWFHAQGVTRIERVLSDNAKNYTRSRDFAAALAAIGARHKTIRPHCPWQNGKAERFNRTLAAEWAYRRIYLSNTDRTNALHPWLDFYNTRRRHTALGGQSPISRVPLSTT